MLQLLQQLNTNQESDSLVKKNKKIILRTHDNSSRGPLGEGPQLCARLRHYKKHNLDPTQKNKKPTIAHNSKNSKWARARRRPASHRSISRDPEFQRFRGNSSFLITLEMWSVPFTEHGSGMWGWGPTSKVTPAQALPPCSPTKCRIGTIMSLPTI